MRATFPYLSNLTFPSPAGMLLGTYYYGSWPLRRWTNARSARQGSAPIMVLFYHRVADHTPNDWTISSRQFARHVQWLRANVDLVSLSEAQRRVREGVNYRPAVSITFDDGYADNCEGALPLLIRHRIACTYFVTSRHIVTGEPFPHDVAFGRPLQPNSVEQLRSLVAAGIEIGAHTRTHADLAAIDDEERLYDELVGARDELQTILGHRVRYFSFPYGMHEHLNSDVFHLAGEAGFSGIFSAYGGYNFPGDDDFHLQRIHGDGEFVRFKNWMTVDPRKVASVRRYQYQRRPAVSAPVGARFL